MSAQPQEQQLQTARTRIFLLVAGLFAIGATLVHLLLSQGLQAPTLLYVTYALAMLLIAFLAWQVILTFRDLHEQNRRLHESLMDKETLAEQLSHQSFHDVLTDLVNRERFTDRVTHALTRRSASEVSVAVLFLDLDDFKSVNETLGHAAGDDLLVGVSQRLRNCLRPSDTASRLGGDEFVILLEDITGPDDAVVVADRMVDSLAEPFVVATKEIFVKSSIGIATNGMAAGEEDAEALLSHADSAMYVAKKNGKNRYEIFEPSMHIEVMRRQEMKADLQRALSRDEFFLVYQPVVALESGRVVGAEALIRWRHPERGVVPPLDFIPLAEETGLILEIGRWVLKEACRQAGTWKGSLPPSEPPLHMNVNVSMRQLQQADFVSTVAEALREGGLEGEGLVLEITESLLIEDSEATVQKLHDVKELGVHIAIDDFGTGYSSLSYLRRFPIDILKIDRSFIQSIDRGPDEAALAEAIVQLSRTFRMATVAEGVELKEHHQKLLGWGCDSGQGFRFSEPVKAPELQSMLQDVYLKSAQLQPS